MLIFRRVRNIPCYIKGDGSLSSALFKDSHGVSVDIDDDRPIEEIILDEERLHDLYLKERLREEPEGPFKLLAIAEVEAKCCFEKAVLIMESPLPENPYHALLMRSESIMELTSSQAKYLAMNARLIKKY